MGARTTMKPANRPADTDKNRVNEPQSMDTVTATFPNGATKTYLRSRQGTCYDARTHFGVVRVLDDLISSRPRTRRVRLDYGDTATGQSWGEEFDIEGYVGRSTGKNRIPLLIPPRARGGQAVLDHCIVAIYNANGGALYRHPAYRPAYFWEQAIVLVGSEPECPFEVFAQNLKTGQREVMARFTTEKRARRCIAKRAKFECLPRQDRIAA